VKLENQEWKTFLDSRHQGTFDVARAGWCADYNEPTSFLNTMLSDSSNNTAHYKSPAFDKMIADTLKTTDEAQRTELYAKLNSSWIKILRSYRFTTTLTPVW
jgi:oligopeptide transport system substrate-binding protein